jgi:hypothetical protein
MGNGLYATLICYNYEFRLDIDQYRFMVSNEGTMARAHHLFHFSAARRQLTQESSVLTSSPLCESMILTGRIGKLVPSRIDLVKLQIYQLPYRLARMAVPY